ncbi:hypothetical protein AAMO2058_001691300 [Amorphochlora amoebiformis]
MSRTIEYYLWRIFCSPYLLSCSRRSSPGSCYNILTLVDMREKNRNDEGQAHRRFRYPSRFGFITDGPQMLTIPTRRDESDDVGVAGC